MFTHIGKKLKAVAKIWCLLGVLASVAAGVLLYLNVLIGKLDLPYCILIAVGGSVVSVLIAWAVYTLGDIHTKLERMEDKLIPKPNYMSYLEENKALRGPCEICGRTTDLINAKIVDNLGTRYRKVCRECFAANQCEER